MRRTSSAEGDTDIAAVAALIGDRARSAMLLALARGEPVTAGELAARAGVTAQTASMHLAKLVRGGLIVSEPQGRLRYYSIANRDVSRTLEMLGAIAPQQAVRSLRASNKREALRFARTCYDHLAGRLGVALFEVLVARDALIDLDGVPAGIVKRRAILGAIELGPHAERTFASFGIDVAALGHVRRQLSAACLDWTETRPHLGGALGAALCKTFFERKWCRRRASDRAVTVTDAGRQALAERLGITIELDGSSPRVRFDYEVDSSSQSRVR